MWKIGFKGKQNEKRKSHTGPKDYAANAAKPFVSKSDVEQPKSRLGTILESGSQGGNHVRTHASASGHVLSQAAVQASAQSAATGATSVPLQATPQGRPVCSGVPSKPAKLPEANSPEVGHNKGAYSNLKESGSNVARPTGIVNKGETCYANSILQALSVFPEFYSLCPESNGFLKAFRNVLERLLAANRQFAVDPLVFLTHLQTQMRTTNPGTAFRWDKQNDVPEVLGVVIEAVTAECVAARELFGVVERYSITCTVCSHVSSRVSPPQNLLYVNVKESLSEMVESCSVDEMVERECAQCRQKQKMAMRTDLAAAPPILILQIRDRFLPSPLNDGSIVRNSQEIKDLSSLNVRVRTDIGVEIGVRYRISAIIHHEGVSNDRGHYFAHINRRDRWFRCNDRAVSPSVLSSLGKDTAYVVFCKKVQ
jgi:uncharacterized UBP type Zn finger protein